MGLQGDSWCMGTMGKTLHGPGVVEKPHSSLWFITHLAQGFMGFRSPLAGDGSCLWLCGELSILTHLTMVLSHGDGLMCLHDASTPPWLKIPARASEAFSMVNRSCWDPKSLSPPPTVLLKPSCLGPAKALPGSKVIGTTALAGARRDAVAPASPGCLQLLSQPWELGSHPTHLHSRAAGFPRASWAGGVAAVLG